MKARSTKKQPNRKRVVQNNEKSKQGVHKQPLGETNGTKTNTNLEQHIHSGS